MEKPARTIFGKTVKFLFIVFNLFMAWATVSGLSQGADKAHHAASDAEKAKAAIGLGWGAIFLIGIWLVGAVILGVLVLFTRPKNA